VELNGQLRFATLPDPARGPNAQCGYIRLTTFDVPDATQFAARMAEILASLPQDKLLIDIRSNPGGLIPAGQKFIRLLTQGEVDPSPIAFRSTTATRAFGYNPMFAQWKPSLDLQYSTGQVFSQAFAVTTFEDVPAYRYPGKIGLVIDGLCYSTSDFFTADFKDNNVGTVIGIDESTGGGGANVWGWNVLTQMLGNYGPGALPAGYDLNLSMRRSLRTGVAAGLPVEDLGVPADIVHQLTRRDVLAGNSDLLAFAMNALNN
jgi:C-terminal processing protease CtpA/Prc